MTKERKIYIDVARGVVILLVALGHLIYIGGVNWLRIFAFHMPFFFIMAGYCTGEQNYDLPFRKFLFKNAKALLGPAVIIRLLYILVGMSQVDFSTRPGLKEIVQGGLHRALNGSSRCFSLPRSFFIGCTNWFCGPMTPSSKM